MVSRPTSLPPAPTSDPRTCARRRGAALWSTLVLGACTGGSPTPAPAGPAPATPASVEAPAIATPAASAADRPAATPTQTAAELRPPAPADATPTSPPVITPTTPVVVAGSGEPPQLPLPPIVAAAGLERVDPGWTLALELDRSVGLEPVDAGVLCRVGGQAHEIGPDGALVARPAVDAGRLAGAWEDAPLLGAWPGDAWYVREKSRDREGSLLTFMRWRGNNRWVAQNDSSDYDENDVLYRWSPRSGMLVTRTHHEDETVTVERLAGKHPSPPDIPLKDGQRIDGRTTTQIRPIVAETHFLPRAHGSALFTRGETQALVTTTLGTTRDAQIIDAVEGETKDPFLFHYNFPPFSVGETEAEGECAA